MRTIHKIDVILIKKLNHFLYMQRFILGFSIGICVGTYYDCKPLLIKLKNDITKHLPKEKK